MITVYVALAMWNALMLGAGIHAISDHVRNANPDLTKNYTIRVDYQGNTESVCEENGRAVLP